MDRCIRSYDNIEFDQQPDKTSQTLRNGEYLFFNINTRCKFCGSTTMMQRQTARECARHIAIAQVRHNLCHLGIRKGRGRPKINAANTV